MPEGTIPGHIVDLDADWRLGFSTDLEMVRLMYPYSSLGQMKYLTVLFEGTISGLVRQGKISFETLEISAEKHSRDTELMSSICVTDIKGRGLKKPLEQADTYYMAAISKFSQMNGWNSTDSWAHSWAIKYSKFATQNLISIANNENLFASATAVHQALAGLGIAGLMIQKDEPQ